MFGLNATMVSLALEKLFDLLPATLVRNFVMDLLEKMEERILGSASTVDDERILPIIAKLKVAVDYEGNSRVISSLLQYCLTELPGDIFDEFMDFIFDWIEDKVMGSASTVDDMLVLPIIDMARALLDVEDND